MGYASRRRDRKRAKRLANLQVLLAGLNTLGRGASAWKQGQRADEQLELQRERAGREEEMFPLEQELTKARTESYRGAGGADAYDISGLNASELDAMRTAKAFGARDAAGLKTAIGDELGRMQDEMSLLDPEFDAPRLEEMGKKRDSLQNLLHVYMSDPRFMEKIFGAQAPDAAPAPDIGANPWPTPAPPAPGQSPIVQDQDFPGLLQTGQPKPPAIDRQTFHQSQLMPGGGMYPPQAGPPGPAGPQAPEKQGPQIGFPDTQANLLPGQRPDEPIDQFMAGLPQGPAATDADRSALGEFGRLWQTVMNPASPEEALLAAWSRLQDFRVQPPYWVTLRLQGAGGGMPA
jgi:hypothetical protein